MKRLLIYSWAILLKHSFAFLRVNLLIWYLVMNSMLVSKLTKFYKCFLRSQSGLLIRMEYTKSASKAKYDYTDNFEQLNHIKAQALSQENMTWGCLYCRRSYTRYNYFWWVNLLEPFFLVTQIYLKLNFFSFYLTFWNICCYMKTYFFVKICWISSFVNYPGSR